MRERLKRGLVIATASLYLFAGVVTPARAFAPLIAVGAAVYATPTGSYVGLSLLGALIGLTGMYLQLEDTEGNKVAIPLSEKYPEPPAPNAPATATPESTTTYVAGGQTYSSYEQACGASIAYQNSRQTTSNFGMGDGKVVYERVGNTGCNANSVWTRYSDGYQQISGPFPMEPGVNPGVTTCPKGYALVNGACNLQNPRQAVDDKRCDYLLSNGYFANANDLNCKENTDGKTLNATVRDGKVVAYGKNNTTGQPLVFTVAPPCNGSCDRWWTGVTLAEVQQTDTQTQVKETEYKVDPKTGTIIGVQTSTHPGTIDAPTSSTSPTTNTSSTTANSPTVKTDTTKNIDTPSCGLPGQPACAVDDTAFGNQTKPWESATKPDFEAPKKSITEWVDPSLSWPDLLPKLTPGQYTACHPIEFRGKADTLGLDATTQLDVCWFFEYVRMFLGWLFGLSAMLYVFRTFTSSQSWEK